MSEYIVDLTDENHNKLMAECDGIHEEIVRCWGCAEVDSESEPGSLHCMVNEWRKVEPSDFCSLGERREQ